jgi:hypothetical protein
MNWNTVLGAACIICYLLPVVVILYNQYFTHRSLAALLIYYSIAMIDNLLGEGYIPSTPGISKFVGLLDNYLDVPLMLTGLLFFCPGRQGKKKIQTLTLVFIAYELVITCIYGFSRNAIIYIMGVGVCVVVVYSSYLFVRQVKFSIFHGKNYGRVLMLSAVLFGYSCYLLIYYFHYIQKTPYRSDVFMLYYISSIIFSVLMALGLQLMRVRMKELESVKTTRKELALFFGHHVQGQ